MAFSAHMHCDHFVNKQTTKDYAQDDYDAINTIASIAWHELLKVILLNAGRHSRACC